MPIQWRKHENILGLFLFLESMISIYIRDNGLSRDTIQIVYAQPFLETGLSFHYFRHVLLPELCFASTLLLTQILFNTIVIPNLVSKGSKKMASLQVLVLLLFLFVSSTINNFLLYEYEYVKVDGSFKNIPDLLFRSLKLSALIAGAYTVYVVLREFIIFQISTAKNSPYLVHISNKVSSLSVIYFALLGMLFFFKIGLNATWMTGLVLLLPNFLLTGVALVFRLFPKHTTKGFFVKSNLLALTTNNILLSIPFGILFQISMHGNGDLLKFLIVTWACQFLFITPVSWWIYQWQSEFLKKIRGSELTLHQTSTDLALLRSQVNPHFLFNSLNTIYGTALKENALTTASAIQLLGDMMRFLTDHSASKNIPLAEEINYLNNYIKFQEIRFGGNTLFQFSYQQQIMASDRLIEPMLLIPFVENAFKHGISNSEPCYVKVHLRCDAERIELLVSNSIFDKKSPDPEANRHGIGLANVRSRLEILYPGKYQLNITQLEKDFSVQLIIQFS